MTPYVGAYGVGVSLGGTQVLDDVDLEVTRGEVVALVGPNGAGKSTLLSALAGDVTVSGEVVLDGEPVTSWTHVELAMRRAVLLQQVTLSFPFIVAEVVRMGRAPWIRTERAHADDDVVADAMRATDVMQFAERSFTSLSGGERARVALARVLAQQTDLLLLDEPTAALDLRHQELVLRTARSHAGAGGAVVVVLHDLGLAAAYADRVVLLSRGRKVADGPPSEIMTGARLSAVYEHPVEVFPHPSTGAPVILPVR